MTLRARAIRLAQMQPEMRSHLLPLLREGAMYRDDPRWIKAKHPGTADDGTPFKRGQEVLYWPRTKTFMVGPKAADAWERFKSEAEDEDFMSRMGASHSQAQAALVDAQTSLEAAAGFLDLVGRANPETRRLVQDAQRHVAGALVTVRNPELVEALKPPGLITQVRDWMH